MALIHRMKVLLGVAQELGGVAETERFHCLLFLYCAECVKRDEYYEFLPLGYPHSLQAEEDKRHLIAKHLLEPSEGWVPLPTEKRVATDLDFFEKVAIQDLKNRFLPKSIEELIAHIAAQDPRAVKPPPLAASNERILYTIGYEGVTPEGYINALLGKGVRLLCDVRRNSLSKKYGFSKSELNASLSRVGIAYRHLPELGIASEKRQTLETDHDYETLFKEYEVTTLIREKAALETLRQWLEEYGRIAITCFEADPWHCHRSRIAAALKADVTFPGKTEHLHPCQPAHPRPRQSERKSS